MSLAIGRWFDRFRGAGEAAVTVPSMDGALQPNNLLDCAEVLCPAEGIANFTGGRAGVYYSRGSAVHRLVDRGSPPVLHLQVEQHVSALAASPAGALAIGLSTGGVVVKRPGRGDLVVEQIGGRKLNCPTALAFADEARLILCNGSATNSPQAWRRDLMERNRSGSVWEVDVSTGTGRPLAEGLGYPCGVLVSARRGVVVSEAWEHRVIALRDRAREVPLDDLPGYPGAISDAADGGFWLSVFAPRRQLVEFVLREDAYRTRMMATLPEDYWIAPALRSGKSYFEPVQGGGVRRLGILKPWAPTRSYGLLIRLDEEMIPITSYHSRADGNRHGIGGAVELDDRVLVASAGAGLLLALDPTLMDE